MRVLVAAISSTALLFGACDPGSTTGESEVGNTIEGSGSQGSATQIEPPKSISEMSVEELASVDNKFVAIKTALEAEDYATADKLAEAYLNELDPLVTSAKIREHFSESGEALHRRATIIVGEHRLVRVEDDGSTRYLIGLAYSLGQSVQADIGYAIEVWDHPSMLSNGATQYRLSELYGDASSEHYNAEKAQAALAASEAAGYVPN